MDCVYFIIINIFIIFILFGIFQKSNTQAILYCSIDRAEKVVHNTVHMHERSREKYLQSFIHYSSLNRIYLEFRRKTCRQLNSEIGSGDHINVLKC